jgi:hypothetical protein
MTLPYQFIHPVISQNTQSSDVDNLVEWVVSQVMTSGGAGSNPISVKISQTPFAHPPDREITPNIH